MIVDFRKAEIFLNLKFDIENLTLSLKTRSFFVVFLEVVQLFFQE